jgi:hypothetical protein
VKEQGQLFWQQQGGTFIYDVASDAEFPGRSKRQSKVCIRRALPRDEPGRSYAAFAHDLQPRSCSAWLGASAWTRGGYLPEASSNGC